MKPYSLTPEASGDLDAILLYIARESSIDRALKIHSVFLDAFRGIARMPGMGHTREELLGAEYRFHAVYSYLVVYRARQSRIEIVAIVHGARDLAALFEKRRF